MLEKIEIKCKINVKNYKIFFWVFFMFGNNKIKSEMKIK